MVRGTLQKMRWTKMVMEKSQQMNVKNGMMVKKIKIVVVLLVSAVPSILLNLPMGLYARIVANKHMAVALAGSNVKVEARDVRLSKMITTCMAGVPMLWLAYAAAMLLAGVSLKHTVGRLLMGPTSDRLFVSLFFNSLSNQGH